MWLLHFAERKFCLKMEKGGNKRSVCKKIWNQDKSPIFVAVPVVSRSLKGLFGTYFRAAPDFAASRLKPSVVPGFWLTGLFFFQAVVEFLDSFVFFTTGS